MKTNSNSIFPKDKRTRASVELVASLLAVELSEVEFKNDPVTSTIEAHLKRYQIEIPENETVETLTDRLMHLVQEDYLYDYPLAKNKRAIVKLFEKLYGDTIEVTGWMPGAPIIVLGDYFLLSGDECPSCELNPLAYGMSGGQRCVDILDCGYTEDSDS